jgi:RIO-like serine/threonine protein kinase
MSVEEIKTVTLKKKKKKNTVETLADKFHSLHLHHLDIESMNEADCKARFKRELKKWTGSSRIRKSYADTCHHQKTQQKCDYVMKVFHLHDKKNPALFRHEVNILKDLQEQKLDIMPRIHTIFTCNRYGLVVMDRWQGDLLELLFSHHQNMTQETLQKIYQQLRFQVETLHRAGYVHGRINFHNIVFQVLPPNNFRLGLVSWAHARALSHPQYPNARDKLLIACDIQALDILFLEIQQILESLEKNTHLPDNIPIALKTRFTLQGR